MVTSQAPHVRNQLERTTVRHLHGTTAATSQLSEMQTGNRPTLVKQQVYDGVRVYEDAIILGVHTVCHLPLCLWSIPAAWIYT